MALSLAGCNGSSSQSDTGTTVIYAAVGTACSADITYQDASTVQTLLPAQLLPWQFPFSVPSKQVNGFPVFLSATNDCVTGTLTVNVLVNGTLYASGTTSVANGTATVNTALF